MDHALPATSSNPHPDLVFVDCEATGLARLSHPLSVGLAWCDGAHEVRLVKPHESWRDIPWDPVSSRIHRLTPELLDAEGVDVQEVANWINGLCAGRIVVSDNPHYEAHWLSVLFRAAGVVGRFAIRDADELLGEAMSKAAGGVPGRVDLVTVYSKVVRGIGPRFPHTHRADEDALRRAMIHREAVVAAASA